MGARAADEHSAEYLRTYPTVTQNGEQVCPPSDRLVDIGKCRIRPHLPDHPRLRHRQPRLGTIDLDAITVYRICHRPPAPREELLTLMGSNASLYSSETIVGHAFSLTYKLWYTASVTTRTDEDTGWITPVDAWPVALRSPKIAEEGLSVPGTSLDRVANLTSKAAEVASCGSFSPSCRALFGLDDAPLGVEENASSVTAFLSEMIKGNTSLDPPHVTIS